MGVTRASFQNPRCTPGASGAHGHRHRHVSPTRRAQLAKPANIYPIDSTWRDCS